MLTSRGTGEERSKVTGELKKKVKREKEKQELNEKLDIALAGENERQRAADTSPAMFLQPKVSVVYV